MSQVKTYIRLKPYNGDTQPHRQIVFSYLDGLRVLAGEWRVLPAKLREHLLDWVSPDSDFRVFEVGQFSEENLPGEIEDATIVLADEKPIRKKKPSSVSDRERSLQPVDSVSVHQKTGQALVSQEQFKRELSSSSVPEEKDSQEDLLSELEQFKKEGGTLDSVDEDTQKETIEDQVDTEEGAVMEEEEGDTSSLEDWKIQDLKDKAKSLGIPGYGRMKKKTLIARIRSKEDENE